MRRLGTWARELTLPDVSRTAEHPRRDRAPSALVGWAVAPLSLLAVGAGVLFVRQGPALAFVVTMSILVGAVLLWVLVSVFSASKADRSCPQCGSESLERLDADTTHGVRCGACEFTDETASSFYLAEQEGALEPMILRERQRKQTEVI
jgi:hypothetical protein